MNNQILILVLVLLSIITNIFFVFLLLKKNKDLRIINKQLSDAVRSIYGNGKNKSSFELISILREKMSFWESQTGQKAEEVLAYQQDKHKLNSYTNKITDQANRIIKEADVLIDIFESGSGDSFYDKNDLGQFESFFRKTRKKCTMFLKNIIKVVSHITDTGSLVEQRKSERISSLSTMVSKCKVLESRLSEVDAMLYKQSTLLMNLLEILPTNNKSEKDLKTALSHFQQKIDKQNFKKSRKIKELDNSVVVGRTIKSFDYIDTTLELLLERIDEENLTVGDGENIIKVVVKEIKKRTKDVSQELRDSLKSADGIFKQIEEHEKEIYDLVNFSYINTDLENYFNNEDTKLDIHELRLMVSKSIQFNEHLLQILGDCFKNSQLNNSLVNLEWVRLQEEMHSVRELNKYIESLNFLIRDLNIDVPEKSKKEINKSDFRVNEDGEIIF